MNGERLNEFRIASLDGNRCRDDRGLGRGHLYRHGRTSVRHISAARIAILSDPADGAHGSSRRNVEIVGIRRLRSPTGWILAMRSCCFRRMVMINSKLCLLFRTGTLHDAVHRIPGPHLLVFPHISGRKRSQSQILQFRRRPLVGSGRRLLIILLFRSTLGDLDDDPLTLCPTLLALLLSLCRYKSAHPICWLIPGISNEPALVGTQSGP